MLFTFKPIDEVSVPLRNRRVALTGMGTHSIISGRQAVAYVAARGTPNRWQADACVHARHLQTTLPVYTGRCSPLVVRTQCFRATEVPTAL